MGKVKFLKLFRTGQERSAKADKKSREQVDAMHNEQTSKIDTKARIAKSAYLASQAADVAAEAAVENNQRADLKRTAQKAKEEQEAMAAAKQKELQSVKVAAESVEE